MLCPWRRLCGNQRASLWRMLTGRLGVAGGAGETSALSAPLYSEPQTAPEIHYKWGKVLTVELKLSFNKFPIFWFAESHNPVRKAWKFQVIQITVKSPIHRAYGEPLQVSDHHSPAEIPVLSREDLDGWIRPALNNFICHRLAPSNAGGPNFWELMPDDLKWRWCNNNRNKVHNKCKALESSPKHPPPLSMEKLSSTKLVPGAKKVGYHCSSEPQNWKEIFYTNVESLTLTLLVDHRLFCLHVHCFNHCMKAHEIRNCDFKHFSAPQYPHVTFKKCSP